MAGKEKPLLLEREKPPRVLTAVKGADGLLRCPWPGQDPLYLAYHDEEWGVPRIRRPGPVREARPRWLPGGALLDHDPAQAPRVPQGVRRL